jgi:nicotinate (nicotinamide) nucleotide adenylyltransferase
MSQRIVLFGGNFNPPGLHHRAIVEHLAAHFDRVLVIPCGPRPDKQITNSVDPTYRAAMADLAFRGLPRVEVELFDLEQATFTRSHALETRFSSQGEVWHAVGTDLIAGGATGSSAIQTLWENGAHLWKHARFAVFTRAGIPLDPADLPPNHELFHLELSGSSDLIRDRLLQHEDVRDLLSPEVAEYIRRHGLYRISLPRRQFKMSFAQDLRLLLSYDERNPKAAEWAKEFAPYERPDDPNCVLVIGGDGSMLRAIQQHWRRRIPFFGINGGHLGFLLNDPGDALGGGFPRNEIVVRHLPMLYVEVLGSDGQWRAMLSFNDAWVERSSGQTAWVQVKVNDQVRIEKLVCDGVLVSTAAGSTAYARAMGAAPLLADTPAWLIVGSNAMSPANWKSAMLPMDAQVEISSLDMQKRPLNGFVYGVPMGEVSVLRARISRIASVEIGFFLHRDLAEKLAQLQFMQASGQI